MTQRPRISRPLPSRRQIRGFGIVELMVAIALGLFLVGGVIGVFVTNQQAYRTTEQLSRMQESGRTAVELMARQVREAGGSPCGRGVPTADVINPDSGGSAFWWANWTDGIRGYDNSTAANGITIGTGAGQRVDGTDAVFLVFGNLNTGVRINGHVPTSAQFDVGTNSHGLVDGDIVLVCNYRQAALLQVTNASTSNSTVVHNTGVAGVSPGNCSKGLGYPTDCSNVNGNLYDFSGGYMVKLTSEIWYIGFNGRGGRSLYRARLVNSGGTVSATPLIEEIAEGVTDMQLTYLETDATGALPTDYATAASVTSWPRVNAVRVTLTLQSLQNVGTDGAALQRQMTHVVTLRNRLP